MDEQAAAEAYDRYASSLGWRLADGQPLPSWDGLPEAQRRAWLVAMQTAWELVTNAQQEAQWIDPRGLTSRWN